jgi:hypothetical protein
MANARYQDWHPDSRSIPRQRRKTGRYQHEEWLEEDIFVRIASIVKINPSPSTVPAANRCDRRKFQSQTTVTIFD